MKSNCPHISQLFFADDAFLFGQASLDEASMFDELINKYSAESGQKVNLNKSSLFFLAIMATLLNGLVFSS